MDQLPALDVVRRVLVAEARVLPAVERCAEPIARGADLLAERWLAGGRWIFAGAGTSGRIAWSQAAELPGTFGLPTDRILCRIAGGVTGTDDDEDDLSAADADLTSLGLGSDDAVVAVAASGTTPYTLAVAHAARDAGATVIAVVARAGSELAGLAEVAIEVLVGDEVLRGSTRLGAGTAQKVALDALTTAAGARTGRVHDDLMLDVVPANAKLRERALGIVAEIAGVDRTSAGDALAACDGNVRAAVLVLVRGMTPAEGVRLAAEHRTLREALARNP